jgi:hypothetical protein
MLCEKIIESLLLEKGYEVYNITSAFPTNSIESYLNNIKFGLLLISVTLEENLDSVSRFMGRDRYN